MKNEGEQYEKMVGRRNSDRRKEILIGEKEEGAQDFGRKRPIEAGGRRVRDH